jgi:hypothetical protein
MIESVLSAADLKEKEEDEDEEDATHQKTPAKNRRTNNVFFRCLKRKFICIIMFLSLIILTLENMFIWVPFLKILMGLGGNKTSEDGREMLNFD